jgi:hypothetical protein
MLRGQAIQPPSLAVWLVDLFAIEERTGVRESMIEKFAEMASRLGTAPARLWYWKQTAKTVASLIARGFRTAPWLIVGTALGGALLLQFSTSSLQRTIMEITAFINHHETPYYDSKSAAAHLLWLNDTVLLGSLLESLIVGCLVAAVAKRREMIAAIILGLVSLSMTAAIFWVLVSIHKPVNSGLFPKIMIEQLSSSFMISIGGVIVREMRSAETRGLSGA